MTNRREFLQIASAAAAAIPFGNWTRAFAQQRLSQADLLGFESLGNVTLVHITDIHAQLVPTLFREPSTNIGVGEAKGLVPHVTGRALLDLYRLQPGSPHAYALTSEDFTALAKTYGRKTAVATVVAFGVGFAVIAGLMAYISKRSFLPFVIYRILLGTTLLVLLSLGVLNA